jgi:hypothetical protein
MNSHIFRPSLLDAPISYFEQHESGYFANVPSQVTSLRRIATTKYYKPIIEKIRIELDSIHQKELKKKLPAITPVALLNHRKRNTSFTEKIKQQWPLLMGDIDRQDNPGIDMAELKYHLSRLPYLMLCAESVRGGLWFVIRLPDYQTSNTLAEHFRYLQKLFAETFGIALDSSKGGNPTDLRFVSYDPAPYLNDEVTVMRGTYTPPVVRPITPWGKPSNNTQNKMLRRCVALIESATDGNKHLNLLKAATLAGGYIASGMIDENTAVNAMENVVRSLSNVASFTQAQRTIWDGIRNGKQRPIYP